MPLYFAYGSNLRTARLRARVPSATPRGVAWLDGFRLTLDKRGADGSAKANVAAAAGERVFGVVYELEAAHWPDLDRCEPGYERFDARVERGGARLAVQTYRSTLVTDDPVAHAWYKRLMVEGAREHGLPPEWVALLEALPAR